MCVWRKSDSFFLTVTRMKKIVIHLITQSTIVLVISPWTPSLKLMFLFRLLTLLVVSLTVTTAKECGTVSRGKELKQLVGTSHVLVAMTTSGDDSSTKDLCERLQQTPDVRVQDLEIVTVADHNIQRKVWDLSRPAPDGWMDRLWFRVESFIPSLQKLRKDDTSLVTPSFVLFMKGTSYDQGRGLRYTGDDMSADTVSTFLASWMQTKKLGNYVYSLGTYDMIAAQTMVWVEKYGTSSLLPRLWVHGAGRVTRYLVQPTSMEFETQLAQMYIASATKVLQHGSDYPQSQVKRLERMLGDQDSNISPLQREDLSQRLYIWRKFAEPMEVSNDDLYKFVGRLLLNLFSVLAMAVLIPLLLFGQEPYEEEEVAEDDANEKDITDKEDTKEQESFAINDSAMTKEEKRVAAIQRAKESMEDDKKKVEAVKSKKQQGSCAVEQHYSREELNDMTVLQMREILREKNERVSGSKSELIDRILGEE